MNNTLTKPEFPEATTGFHDGRRGNLDAGLPPLGRRLLGWLLNTLERMTRRPAPPLNLELTDRFVRFHGMREFEFALVSRTDFPASRVRELMAHSPRQLEAAAGRVRDAERLLSNVLARSVNDPALTGELFRELELKLFSQDHGWREIVDGLKRLPPGFDEYKRVALIKYMQYLRARQIIMRSAFVEKTRDDDEAGLHATPSITDDTAPSDADGGADGGRVTCSMAAGDTAAFHRTAGEGEDAAMGRGYRSLPKGETVSIDPGAGRHVELQLAGNRMRLYTGRECYLVDDDNHSYPLRQGKNLVGRHHSCDVVLDAACKSISRRHLIIEPLTGGSVLMTDLSSHGTEVAGAPPKAG